MTKLKGSFLGMGLSAVVLFAGPSHAAPTKITATLVKVVDGDTVHVRKAPDATGKAVVLKVRFLGMDTPEAHFQNKAQDPWGGQATEHLLELLNATPTKTDRAGHIISGSVDKTTGEEIVVEVEQDGSDKYGRDLGYIYKDGVNLNLKMVEDGHAYPYLYCVKGNCQKDFLKTAKVADFVDACKTARSKKLGIFDAKNPIKETAAQFRRRIDKRKPYQYLGDYYTKQLYRPEDESKADQCTVVRFDLEEDALNLSFRY